MDTAREYSCGINSDHQHKGSSVIIDLTVDGVNIWKRERNIFLLWLPIDSN